uniref:Phospholipid-transporting ATPase n=1 Tax=Panagrolaimus superbus TaxID=310955 RepID=A0A914Y6V3_9BILA
MYYLNNSNFFKLFFLCIAISQFIEALRIGSLIAYWGPLGFVLSVTLIREGYEDFLRFLRDRKVNQQEYKQFLSTGYQTVLSKDIQVGDIILLHKNQRIPADVILLRTSEPSGGCFIRTDQLDGETDWKLRLAIPALQELHKDKEIFDSKCEIYAEAPHKDIYNFIGTCRSTYENRYIEYSLSVENILWATTTLTAGTAIGLVIYTGKETRSEMNCSSPQCKVGLLDLEINQLTKYLFLLLLVATIALESMKGYTPSWPRDTMRFALLLSYVIPISLRVNLEMAKLYYSYTISHDKQTKNMKVRTSSIPEELGRISFLLTDKTGTLTKNEMQFRKLHIGSISVNNDSFDFVDEIFKAYSPDTNIRNPIHSRIYYAVEALALCHNVTPIKEKDSINYQASSPDEIALVEWTQEVGITLISRDFDSMSLKFNNQDIIQDYRILHLFPFTSERKRMGIIVQNIKTNEKMFICKGADTVMSKMVSYNDWLDEECSNMAREGLRTLVVAKKILTQDQYSNFYQKYHQAKMSTHDRNHMVENAIESLEENLQLLCATGVEDQLQNDVRASIESLIQAGIKICMLTGDKLETAICIAQSCGLIKKTSQIFVMSSVERDEEIIEQLTDIKEKMTIMDSVFILPGDCFDQCFEYAENVLADLFEESKSVICCRCSPEQKAKIVTMIKKHKPNARVAAIGDGGNDVAMIQKAHVGIGIEAKEGKQASLAADFAIDEFSNICPLLMYHGRYAYKQTCILAQFVMYRGIILSLLQIIFCHLNQFITLAVFDSLLMMAYTSIYTPLAVFAIVTDRDMPEKAALTYSELYKGLVRGRALTLKTFLIWLLIAIYQGGALYYGYLIFQDYDYLHFQTAVYSALILTQLLVVIAVFRSFRWALIASEIQCLASYIISLFILNDIFDQEYILSWRFPSVTLSLTLIAIFPVFFVKFLRYRYLPPSSAKVK